MRRASFAVFLLWSSAALAQNLTMIHSGYVLDENDKPLTSTDARMTFRILNVRDLQGTGELVIWESKPCSVQVRNGFYSVALGSDACNGLTSLQGTHIPPGATRYLEVKLNEMTFSPRLLLGAVPTAAVASVALEAKALTIPSGAAGGLALLSDANGSGRWGTIGSSGITDGSITDVDLAQTAAIATSKLSGPVTAIANHGLGALATRDSIADADVAATAGISTSKLSGPVTAMANHGLGSLATRNTVADADVAAGAAIAGSKISPNFGGQNVLTTGSLGIGTASPADRLHVAGGIRTSAAGTGPVDGAAVLDFAGLEVRHDGASLAVSPTGLGVAINRAAPAVTLKNSVGPSLLVEDGNVGLGTATPREKLEVSGNVQASSFFIRRASLPVDGNWYKLADAGGRWGRLAYVYDNGSANSPAISSGDLMVINDNFSLRMHHRAGQYGSNNNLQFARTGNAAESGTIWVKASGTAPGTIFVTENDGCTIYLDGSNIATLPAGVGQVVYPQLRGDTDTFSHDVVVGGSLGVGLPAPAATLDVGGVLGYSGAGTNAVHTFKKTVAFDVPADSAVSLGLPLGNFTNGSWGTMNVRAVAVHRGMSIWTEVRDFVVTSGDYRGARQVLASTNQTSQFNDIQVNGKSINSTDIADTGALRLVWNGRTGLNVRVTVFLEWTSDTGFTPL